MRNVTKVQKKVLLDLSAEFYPSIQSILERGGPEEIVALCDEDCAALRSFGDMIVDAVGDKYPEDDDKNDDAILVVNVTDRIIARYGRSAQ